MKSISINHSILNDWEDGENATLKMDDADRFTHNIMIDFDSWLVNTKDRANNV